MGDIHTTIVLIFAYVAFPGMAYMTYGIERRYTKLAGRERVQERETMLEQFYRKPRK
jgi:hypothetical protein